MPDIDQLGRKLSISQSDLIPFFSNDDGDDFTVSVTNLAKFLLTLIPISNEKTTQYSAPSSTGFSVQITDSSSPIWLILTPTGTFANGSIILPAKTNCIDKQEILVISTQIITTLAITPNGSTVTGAPSTMAANAFFRLRFDAVTSTWYRVG